jgi:tetratricopeptide (TPR) repeat protein
MNQNTETTGSTQPNKPVSRGRLGRAFLFNALGLIVILALAVLGGYQSGIAIRKNALTSAMVEQLMEQYEYTLVDIEFGRYSLAKQRLEWIISVDPAFPGAQEKLTEVLVLMNVKTPTPTPSPSPTPDFSGAEQAYARAQQLIAAQDWPGALAALDEMRKLDPNYQQSQVDGMYYFAFRNYGYDLITKQGNLEGGIYQFTLAERFGPLDRDSASLREGARYYLIGASFWELDWEQAVFYFDQVYRGYAGLWDGTMTAAQRYWYASMRYADELFAQGKYCEEGEAIIYYRNAQAVAALDQLAQSNFNELQRVCFPATGTPSPTLQVTPTTDSGIPTDTPPADTPTDTPPTP